MKTTSSSTTFGAFKIEPSTLGSGSMSSSLCIKSMIVDRIELSTLLERTAASRK